jgi:hypothetical protein
LNNNFHKGAKIMGKKKEAVTIDLSAFDVKMADGKKAKGNKPDRLVIDSPVMEIENPNFNSAKTASATNPKMIKVAVVDRCIELGQQIENLLAEQALHEQTVKDAALKAKTEALEDDTFVKTVDVSGSVLKLQIQFRDAYSKLDFSMRAPLQQVFGDKYPLMFAESTFYTLREGKIEELKTLLGEKFDAFFDTDQSIKPTKEFQATFFALRKSLKPEQLAVVEKVKAAAQSSPAVEYPK